MEMTDAPTHAAGRYGAVMVLKIPLIAPFVVPSRGAHAERHAWPGWLASAWSALPSGMAFCEADWQRRHRLVVALLWGHALALTGAFVLLGYDPAHTVTDMALLVLATLAASLGRLDRRWRMLMASMGLMHASATIVHLTGGLIEAHFHFFIVVGVISLYGDWTPFLIALGYVLVHHGIVGTLAPDTVYNHSGALAHPWRWAVIHAGAIFAASAVQLVHWRLGEQECQRRLTEEHARQAAEEEARLRRDLLAIAAHELRTPITTLGGYAEMLERRLHTATPDPRTERYVTNIQEQTRRLSDLISSLLDVSRIEGGALPCIPEAADLGAIVATGVAQVRPLAPGHTFTVVTDTPAVIGDWDRLRLEQVVVNLVANAARYSPPSSEVRVTVERDADRAIVRVADQGTGIASEDLDRIFEQFYRARDRAERETPARRDGLGLGLYIARAIVERHGGTLRAESAGPGQGSTFIVELPLSTPVAA
jgi:signal transduction histidine kinase